MGRKFRKIEDVFAPGGDMNTVRKMRYVVKDYDSRKRVEREKALRVKRKQRQK